MGDDMGSPDDGEGQDIEYDEMDLTPYEEDDDDTLHKKLVAAKIARKRAEEDLKLLCNRIGLLKMEEGKVSRRFKTVCLSDCLSHIRSYLQNRETYLLITLRMCLFQLYIGGQEDR
jgi:hypothetical protein